MDKKKTSFHPFPGGTDPGYYRLTKRDKEAAILPLTFMEYLELPFKLMSIFSHVFMWEAAGEP